MRLLGPLESASNQMCEDSSSISVQFPIAKILSKTIETTEIIGLGPIRDKMMELLREKFFDLPFKRFYFICHLLILIKYLIKLIENLRTSHIS